jgi:hypothetical protein
MLAATGLTAFFFYRLIRTETIPETAGYMTFLLLLLPAVQIYYLATLDALITGLLMATLYLFCFCERRLARPIAILTLSASFLLTFVSVFILPVLVCFELIVKRDLKRSVAVIGGAAVIHCLLYFFTGYNAFHAFHAASLYENPSGFMLFVNPVNYFFTRIEDVAEILLFFGPFLFVLFVRGVKNFNFTPLNVLTILGCLTLLAMFATGAWRTGETARACAFIYPFLLFPIGRYLDLQKTSASMRLQLAALVFGQKIAMQTFGEYHW